ncbi:MAG: DUF6178 family protein [Pseudomonadota bacterium]
MASRLSEESLVRVYDGGLQAFRWEARLSALALQSETVDLIAMLTLEKAKESIQSLAPQVLYRSLMKQGVSDCLDILPLMSQEQFVAILDYDAWADGELQHRKVFQWLQQFREAEREQIYTRFRDLEEEMQIALVGPFIRAVDPEDFEQLSDEEQDRLESFPGGALYYEVKSEDPEIRQFFADFLEVTMGENMEYAMSVLAHAGFMPPNEQEALMSQFRNARMEDDGFVSYEESLSIFHPISLDMLEKKWSAHEKTALSSKTKESFMQLVMTLASESWDPSTLNEVRSRHAYLANALCSAARVEPGDLESLDKALEQVWSLNGLALEWLASGNIEQAALILKEEHPKTLFQTACTLIERLRHKGLKKLETYIPETSVIRTNLELQKFGLAQKQMDLHYVKVFGPELTERLKAIYSRFPMVMSHTHEGKIIFRPIDSLNALDALQDGLEIALMKLQLVSLTHVEELAELDAHIQRSMVSVQLGGHFINRFLTQNQVDTWRAMSNEAYTEANEKLYSGLDELLMNDRRWSLSANRKTDHLMSALSELAAGLTFIKDQGHFDALFNLIEASPNQEEDSYAQDE